MSDPTNPAGNAPPPIPPRIAATAVVRALERAEHRLQETLGILDAHLQAGELPDLVRERVSAALDPLHSAANAARRMHKALATADGEQSNLFDAAERGP